MGTFVMDGLATAQSRLLTLSDYADSIQNQIDDQKFISMN